jgi:hypothetical protein
MSNMIIRFVFMIFNDLKIENLWLNKYHEPLLLFAMSHWNQLITTWNDDWTQLVETNPMS